MAFTPANKVQNGTTFTNASDVLTQKYKQEETKGLEGLAVGVAKGILSTFKGLSQIGEKVGNVLLPKALEPKSAYSEEALQQNLNEGGAMGKVFNKDTLEAKGTAEMIGKSAEQIAEFAIPSSKIAKVTEGLKLIPKVSAKAGTSATVASAQSGEVGKDALIAGGVETALPIVGKVMQPVKSLVSRVVKGLATGLSGTSGDALDLLMKNSKLAKNAIKELDNSGNTEILKKNSQTILNGVSQIRKEARQSYGDALETLAKEDIDPKLFRSKIQPTLDKYGSKTEGVMRLLEDVEFSDATNLKKASAIIDKVSGTELDGKSLKKTIDWVESKRYKTATTDERLSYNAFVDDITESLKKTINESTDKLGEMNAKYTADLQLTEAIEKIFGKVKFKNAMELNAVSQKMESLFSKKGLSPQYIDDFLNRLGLNPDELKTSEAVRQISKSPTAPNAKGLNIGELIQSITSGVVTPKMVRNVAVITGMAEEQVSKVLMSTEPTVKSALIKALTEATD